MENWYEYEDYQPLSVADAVAIEEAYHLLYRLLERAGELFEDIEHIVEGDRIRRGHLFMR